MLTQIRKMISEKTGIDPEDFGNKSRKPDYVLARQLYCSVLYEQGKPICRIAELLGRNHATVIHSLKQVDNLCLTDKEYSRIHSEVLYLADLIFNGEPVPKEDPIEVKHLKTTISRLRKEIEKKDLEISSLQGLLELERAKYERAKLEDSFSN